MKFKYKDLVKVTKGFYKGLLGEVTNVLVDYDTDTVGYTVTGFLKGDIITRFVYEYHLVSVSRR